MRLERPDLDLLTRKRISSFSSWLLDIGNGSIGTLDKADPLNSKKISIPAEYLIPNSSDALASLIDFIYDSDTMDIPNPIELSKKAIVCPRNDTVDEAMTNHRINQLKPYKAPLPIDIRVIRKYTTQWSPTDKPQLFYLLIDADGNTIEAKVQTKRNKLDSHITLYSCYNIDGVESTSTMMKRKDYNLMKISAIDLSGQVIEITLWEDIGYNYVNSLAPGMVTAITSLIVTTHAGKIQLESTSATTVEIEPPVEDFKESIQKLKRMPKAQTIVYGQQTDKDIRDNITTLQNIVSMNPDSIDVYNCQQNYRFACKATVKEFHGYRKWYRRKCPSPDCDDTLRPEEDYLLCKHCGRIDNPVYTYCVNGTLDDGTATLPVVFFDNAVTQAIGIDCETMVLKNGYEDPKIVPNPILSLAGQEKIYSFSMHRNKDASIQKTLEVDSATGMEEIEDISHKPIETAPATSAAKISRKQPTYDPGTQESTRQEYSRRKKAKNVTTE
ncbi:hypothetical protein SSX86_029695 [Deinandra increscens subsp. villosa]|uniref:Uncharacterized protein n=1 Tax=Deinandra increscens subsp. villosa TaxID=3103831 RepID=A0AAP0CAZ5_9ASTR